VCRAAQSAGDAQQRGLAGAVGAEDRERLAALDAELLDLQDRPVSASTVMLRSSSSGGGVFTRGRVAVRL
jgi:hypothetical protein